MLADSAYLIAFRIIHILAAIAWGGSVFLFVISGSWGQSSSNGWQYTRDVLGQVSRAFS